MFVTSHVAAGAIIGRVSRRPVEAFAAGVFSHVVMDMCPHYGCKRTRRTLPGARRPARRGRTSGLARRVRQWPVDFLVLATLDGLIAAIVAGSLGRRGESARWAVVAGMLGAALLDMDKPTALFFGRSCFPRAVDRLHTRIQNEAPHRLPHEIVAAYSLVSLADSVLRSEGPLRAC